MKDKKLTPKEVKELKNQREKLVKTKKIVKK